MAKVKSSGYTDTAISGVSSLTFPRGLLNFTDDWVLKENQAGKEAIITNITCPVDRPEKIRYAYSDIANVYSGTGIEPSVFAPTKRGVSLLVQATNVISVTDSVDADYRVDLPVSYHLVIKVPASEHITAADVQTGIGRLLSGLFYSGVTTTDRLEALLRGSLASYEV